MRAIFRLISIALVTAFVAVALPRTAAAAELDLALYGSLLDRYTQATEDTVGTRVDYQGLRRDPRWKQLVANVGSTAPSTLRTRAARIAYWSNVYNILAIQTVVEHYPVESIRDVGSLLSPVWKREAARIEGKAVTLHEIEHEILRKIGEPRIHAAIVCASTSCPSLARTPYSEQGLDAELDATLRRWLADRTKGARIDRNARRVWLSRIFEWFEADFEASGGVLAFVAPHLSEPDRKWLEENAARARIEHFDYDWSLNDWKR